VTVVDARGQVSRSPVDQAVAARVAEVRRLTERALGAQTAGMIPRDTNPGALADRLSAVVEILVRELRGRPEMDEQSGRLITATLAAQDLAAESQRRVVAHRSQLDSDIERGLGEFRGISSPNELLDRACGQVIRSCGFRRSMLSRVEGDTWIPWRVRFKEDREAEAVFGSAMTGAGIALADAALERSVLEQRRPASVVDAANDPRTYKPMIEAGRTWSYVVAPIIPAGRVVGFLHADHYPSARPVDTTDEYALWAFAEGFGRLYERAVLLERLEAQRSQIQETFDVADEIMTSLAAADLELVRDPADRASVQSAQGMDMPTPSVAIDALLTDREREVLEMMVRGFGNGAIAERLVIKEGTVKSHVKHILRKLGAVNRAEAIARYLGGTFDD